MPPTEKGFQERLAAAIAHATARRFLYLYWLLANAHLNKLADESAQIRPVDWRSEDVRAWMRKVQEHVDESDSLMLQLRRVEGYLGHKATEIDPRTVEDMDFLTVAKWVRALTQNGDSDEDIARWLRNFLSPRSKSKRGRPAGVIDCDGHALDALVLHDSAPRLWTYPKLADVLLGCKAHKPHTSESDCTGKLKKAVERLRKFLRELGYE
jgi:hypothetical protein